ncbi:MAG: DUF4974 domain-containing protein [Odoribacteraceae bacterium]|jgi:ferric-dicitrate binding protein FerR (iron transport regulator)|nr:DUF4974 domain-containing protein [Odoribacteraceae bacterium]
MKEIFELSEIIVRYLAGELTDCDRLRLEAWLEESPAHRELFLRVQDDQALREKRLDYRRVDVAGALEKFLREKKRRERIEQQEERIEQQKGIQQEKRIEQEKIARRGERRRETSILRPGLRRWGRVAGVLVLAVGAWWLLGERGNVPAEEEKETKQEMAAGVTLSTGAGEAIELTSAPGEERRIAPDLLFRQDSGVARLMLAGENTKNGEEEIFRTVSVPRGGEFKIMLEDGTMVWVNAETRLSFPLAFTGEHRLVRLEGEAYFEVARAGGKEFHVETPGATVVARGTSFNVSTHAPRALTVATLVTGSVGFQVRVSGEEVPMSPGEQVVLDGDGWSKRVVNPLYFTSWREGWLSFESARLEDVLEVVARWYNVDVLFANDEARGLSYTGQVRRYDRFEEVLEVISLTRSARFSVDERTIIVH